MHEPTKRPGNVDRRTFIKGAAAGVAATTLSQAQPARAQTAPGGAQPRNVIVYVGDGLDMGALPIAQHYCQAKLGRNLHWIDWLASGGARRSMLDTSPAERIITDSAAAAANWSIGEAINRDSLCITPEGRRPTPLFRRAKEAGLAVGALTNTEVLDATPAAMYANARSRSDIESIAQQMFDAQLDLLVGGGAQRFTEEQLGWHDGLTIARSLDDLHQALAGQERVLGLLTDGEFPFEIERPSDFPTFADFTRMSLQRMAGLDEPFLLLMESEHIDTCTHANDAAAMMREVVAWDEGLKVCLDFCNARDDTLLLVLSDHSNSAPVFAGYRENDHEQFEAMCNAPHSFRWLLGQYRERGGDPDTVDLVAVVRDATGVTITAEEAAILTQWFKGERVDPFEERNGYLCPLGSVMGNHFGVAFATFRHTTSYVEALSQGPGSERMPHFGHQTDVHSVITQALGLA